jgi:hypothetical protein
MGPRWNRWKCGFELFAVGKGVVDPEQKKALLLHTAGISVQDIYFTLQIAKGMNTYITPLKVPSLIHNIQSYMLQDKHQFTQQHNSLMIDNSRN